MTKALIITSTFLRHQFVINRLAQLFDLVGVWQEAKAFKPAEQADTSEDGQLVARHFQDRDASEERYFGEHAELRLPKGCRHRLLASREINQAEHLAAMAGLTPDVVFVFGSSILGAGLIEAFAGKILNLHLGLSPYYRGSGTNFWPLVNREPEFVGATIHYLDAGIDSGPMLAHVRPEPARDDGPHDLGNKTIAAAVRVLAQAGELVAHGGPEGVPQDGGGGRLYGRKDFNPAAVRQLYRNFQEGMMTAYIDNRQRRDARLSLIQLGGGR